ncbi:hypothetical protein [Streptomyces sp. x-80]|uniref:hypothetical protein n=1 Tax=Streptomyces sp. x-80 TaxID=2789282 RepID=UPI00397F627E
MTTYTTTCTATYTTAYTVSAPDAPGVVPAPAPFPPVAPTEPAAAPPTQPTVPAAAVPATQQPQPATAVSQMLRYMVTAVLAVLAGGVVYAVLGHQALSVPLQTAGSITSAVVAAAALLRRFR